MKNTTQPFDEAVVAQTHSSLYLMHKYWARKPHNVVGRYIEYYTQANDTVLDPFMGSGVTVIEALRLGRRAIGNDLNPIACLIARMTLLPISTSELIEAFERVETSVKKEITSCYEVECGSARCEKSAFITQAVWKRDNDNNEHLFLIKVKCPYCGKTQKRKPTQDDLRRYKIIARKTIPAFYPKNVKLHATAKRSVEYIHQLFVHRTLFCLSVLLKAIKREKKTAIRNALFFCFSSNLGQMAKLNSVDMRPGREYSSRGWVIPNYWIPQGFLETNVWEGFSTRFAKIKKGKAEALKFCNSTENYKIINGDAAHLKDVENESIDYIFTDPPYGDAVPYLGLSLMWAAWLGLEKKLDFDHEIVISERGDYERELEEYRLRLKDAFHEMFRVLRPNCCLTVTFHNREIRVWNALVSAALEAGFIYENDNYVLPAVQSSKSQLAKSGSMTGDIYINFRKPQKITQRREMPQGEIEKIITEEAKMIIQSRNGQATTDQLARGIFTYLIKENLFGKILTTDIKNLLSTLPLVEIMPNVWSLQKTEPETMLAYIPLAKRIEFIVDSVLQSDRKAGYTLDDFLVPIFTHLKNGLTPESKEITDILRQRATVKRNQWFPQRAKQGILFPEYEPEAPAAEAILPAEELREHEQFIYQLARLGGILGYQVWVGRNEQNKSGLLQKLSAIRLEIPGLTEKFIADNRLDQIDLIWLNPDEGRYAAFEIENSTGVVPGIQRLANLTEKLKHLKIPIYVVIPDKFKRTARKIFDSPSGKQLGSEYRRYIVYSKLLHNIDLFNTKRIRPEDLLDSISELA